MEYLLRAVKDLMSFFCIQFVLALLKSVDCLPNVEILPQKPLSLEIETLVNTCVL